MAIGKKAVSALISKPLLTTRKPQPMPDIATLLIFVGASLVFLLIPGPAVFYIVARSLAQGRTAGLVSVLGVQCGAAVHIAAAAFGLSAILVSSAFAFAFVKYLGAAYLIYLGIRHLLARETLMPPQVTADKAHWRLFREGFLVNLFNPKTALFFLAFLPQFIEPARGAVASQILILGGTFITLAIFCDGLWALLAGSASSFLRRNPRIAKVSNYISGSILIALGALAAFVGSDTDAAVKE